MTIVAKFFNCNERTYNRIYKDAVKRAFLMDGIEIDENNIEKEIIELPGDTIQSQRRPSGSHSRTISVYDNENLKYIIGVSNTGYDFDKLYEKEQAALRGVHLKYRHGNDNYHSNTYMCQGINKIFNKYYSEKRYHPDVKLCFYLLDKQEKSYPGNLSNTVNYRKLATLGFKVLNLENISFDPFNITDGNIGYDSFNTFINDIAMVSSHNTTNQPSYLKCIDNNYNIGEESEDEDYEGTIDNSGVRYIYTFKTLGAESYDSFLTMRVLQTLADREDKNLEFLFTSEKYNFRKRQNNVRFTTNFPGPIISLFSLIGSDITYETSEDVLQNYDREFTQYETARDEDCLRNQELFKNNMREKGVMQKCCLCGCEVDYILEAAHLRGVAEIKRASEETIDNILSNPCFQGLIDDTNPDRDTLFYKKYVLANCGDNGIWLCRNHHRLLDHGFYQFEDTEGRVETENIDNEFFNNTTFNRKIPDYLLTDRTKLFLLNHSQS